MMTQRVILDAALDRSVIRGTLTAPIGNQREFHGWLELNAALEAMLSTDADHSLSDRSRGVGGKVVSAAEDDSPCTSTPRS